MSEALTFRAEAELALCPPSPPEAPAVIRADVPRPPPRWQRIAGHTATAMCERSLVSLGVAGPVAAAVWFVGLPWLSLLVLAIGAVYFSTSVAAASVRAIRRETAQGPLALPLAFEVEPAAVAAPDLRAGYEDILRLHEEIRTALAVADRAQAALITVFAECGAVVQAAGRLARLANPLHAYLGARGGAQAKEALGRLAASADVATDRVAETAYRGAAAARGRQLGTLLEIQTLRERTRARLELIAASLESVLAMVIKLQALDGEEVELAGARMTDQLAAVGDELALLESALEEV